jgi:hypothetical protein
MLFNPGEVFILKADCFMMRLFSFTPSGGGGVLCSRYPGRYRGYAILPPSVVLQLTQFHYCIMTLHPSRWDSGMRVMVL